MKMFKLILLLFILFICFSKDSFNYKVNSNVTKNDVLISPNLPYVNELVDFSLINDELINLKDKYPEFVQLLQEGYINIPLKNKFIPQGITVVNNNLLIVGYYEDGKNSRCYVINEDGNIINTVELDTNSHVGGIAYDKDNDLIWIPDNDGILNVYKCSDMFNKKQVKARYSFNDVSDDLIDYINKDKKHIAYLTIDDGYIYIGNFYKTKKCIVKKYKISLNKTLTLEYINSFSLPPKVQGLTFSEINDKKYMIVSCSYNRMTPSNIYVYEYKESIKDYTYYLIDSVVIPPMSEQITVKDEKLYIIFESGASKYFNGLDKVKYVCVIDLDRLF